MRNLLVFTGPTNIVIWWSFFENERYRRLPRYNDEHDKMGKYNNANKKLSK